MVFLLLCRAGEAPPGREVLPGWGVEDASDKVPFGKGDTVLGGDDEVVQHPHINQCEGVFL